MLAETTRLLWRRRWLIALPLVLVFAVPAVASLQLSRAYVSKGTLEVQAPEAVSSVVAAGHQPAADEAPVDEALDLAQQLLLSRTFLLEVARTAGMAEAAQSDPDAVVDRLQGAFDVIEVGPTQLEVHATAGDPVVARDLAQGAIELLLTERRRRVAADAQSADEVFRANVDRLRSDMVARQADLEAFRQAHPEAALAPDKQQILNQLSVLRAQLGQTRVRVDAGDGDPAALAARELDLLTEINNLAIPVGATPNVELELLRLEAAHQEARSNLDDAVRRANEARLLSAVQMQRVAGDTVIDEPFVPSAPARGQALTAAALALVVALVLAAGLVALAEHLDPTVRRVDDVVDAADLPVLAVLARP